MIFSGVLGRVAGTALTGLVGAAAYDGLKHAARQVPAHEIVVTTATWGLRGVRQAERGAEAARLATADVIAEARGRLGEQAPVPAPCQHTSTTTERVVTDAVVR